MRAAATAAAAASNRGEVLALERIMTRDLCGGRVSVVDGFEGRKRVENHKKMRGAATAAVSDVGGSLLRVLFRISRFQHQKPVPILLKQFFCTETLGAQSGRLKTCRSSTVQES